MADSNPFLKLFEDQNYSENLARIAQLNILNSLYNPIFNDMYTLNFLSQMVQNENRKSFISIKSKQKANTRNTIQEPTMTQNNLDIEENKELDHANTTKSSSWTPGLISPSFKESNLETSLKTAGESVA